MEQLPGQYVLLRASLDKFSWAPPINPNASRSFEGKIYETENEEEWADMFWKAWPDVVLTSQIPFVPKGVNEKTDVRAKCMKFLGELKK